MMKFAILLFISLAVCACGGENSNISDIRKKLATRWGGRHGVHGDYRGPYAVYGSPYGEYAYPHGGHNARGYGRVASANAASGPSGASAGAASEYAPRANHHTKHAPFHRMPSPHHPANGATASATVGHGQQFYPPNQYQPPVFAAPRYGAPPASRKVASAAATAGPGGSADAVAGTTGGTAASATATSGHVDPHSRAVSEAAVYNEHFEQPENVNTYAAAHGTYDNNGDGHESSSYARSTKDVHNHEDGRQNDNHYYNAHSYGNTYDENKHEAFQKNDEDVVHTPTVFRSTKSSTNYVKDLNKARRESGSGVLAHDKHSSSYNKNSRKFNEQVDKRKDKRGAGVADTASFSSSSNFDDEDDEIYDSDGLGTFVGVDGIRHPARPTSMAAATATSSVGNGGVSTSTAVGNGAASSSASSGH